MTDITVDYLTESLLTSLNRDDLFNTALDITRGNSYGKLWLIGGYLYKTLIRNLYGLSVFEADFDFLVESPSSGVVVPDDWKIMRNKFGNPEFVKGNITIDFVPLKTFYSICMYRLEPTIENYLNTVPLTVQSIAFEVNDRMLIGDVGISAIRSKTVGANDLNLLEIAANMKGISVNDLIRNKAETLGFSPVYH